MRKSSRGNPYHDERGRFTTANGSKSVSELSESDYQESTEERAIRRHAENTGKSIDEARKDFDEVVGYNLRGTGRTEADIEYARREATEDFMIREYGAYVVNKDGSYSNVNGGEIQKGMLVEYAPEFCGKGEEKYVSVVTEIQQNPITGEMTRAKISTLNTKLSLGSTQVVDFEMIKPASKAKIDAADKEMNKMPWESDPKYKNHKNGQLMWLMDHPESKYNDEGFLAGIRLIESAADSGVTKKARLDMFKSLCKRHGMTEAEARHFIEPEFLE